MEIKYKRIIQTVVFLVISCTFFWGCSFLNDYQDSGELNIAGLKAPVKVMRDEKGMAYIYARNKDDAMNALQKSLGLALDRQVKGYLTDGPLKIGSNNWVVSSRFSPGGKPIFANDPHLDARILPGPWYPCALITPDFRVVGTGFPGIGGMIVFRNEHVAVGVTNSYGDAQDLYVETVDPQNPDHYLEGDTSIPFTVLEENLTIKDKNAPDGIRQETIQIRLTRRGPVVSDIFPKLKTGKVLTLRWAPFETIQPDFPLDKLLYARSAAEIHSSLRTLNLVMLNYVFADVDGNIGWQTSGKLPIREQRDATLPYVVSGSGDNWKDWIPFEEMPHDINPDKGWVGTCNHYTPPGDYPFYYSSYAAASFRYERLKQLLDSPGLKTPEDHWRYQRDTLNLMAKTTRRSWLPH